MKTSELTGAALDWAVTKCQGYSHDIEPTGEWGLWGWATDWAQGGAIIEREISRLEDLGADVWEASGYGHTQYGTTPLIAAMRCYVASRLGDEVELPRGLLNETLRGAQ